MINLCRIEEQRVFRCTGILQVSVDPTVTNLQDLQKYFFSPYGGIVMTTDGRFLYNHYNILKAIEINGGCTSFKVFVKGPYDVAVVSPLYNEPVLWFQKSSDYDVDYLNLQMFTTEGNGYLISKLFPAKWTTVNAELLKQMEEKSEYVNLSDDFSAECVQNTITPPSSTRDSPNVSQWVPSIASATSADDYIIADASSLSDIDRLLNV